MNPWVHTEGVGATDMNLVMYTETFDGSLIGSREPKVGFMHEITVSGQ